MGKDNFFGRRIRPLLQHKVFSLIILLVLMVVLFTVWSAAKGGQFFKVSTLRNILNSIVLSAFLTMGAGFLLIAGHLDLSQASIGAFGGMVLASAIKNLDAPWYIGMILALALCAFFGAINAAMVTKFRFPPFIVTLAMASVAQGLMFLFSSIGRNGVASNVAVLDPALDFLGKSSVGPVPIGIIFMLAFFLFYGILISKTKFGMKVMLMGGNPLAANLAGINSKKITYILFMNTAVLGGVAGIFNTARLGQGALLALQTNQFTGITAAILGGISFGGGTGGMGGAFIGLLILNTFQIGMGVVGVNPYWVNVFSGLILLIALTMDFVSQRRISKAKSV